MSPFDEKHNDDQQRKQGAPDRNVPEENLEIKNPCGSMAYNYLYRDDYGYLDD